MQKFSKAYPIRLSFECEKAWLYLKKHGINPCEYLRNGGENCVIEKAKEFNFRKQQKDIYSPF